MAMNHFFDIVTMATEIWLLGGQVMSWHSLSLANHSGSKVI